MSQQYIGEIRTVGFNFAPLNWALCNGQLIAISQNTALFTLIGTTYGGDGVTTFALPNLQGRVPVHVGSGFVQGALLGTESVSISVGQMPAHSHSLQVQPSLGTITTPSNNFMAGCSDGQYAISSTSATAPLQTAGGNVPHENLQPYLTINYVISLYGIFPSRN